MTERRTKRWRGVVGVALFVGAVGLVAKRPPLLLLAGVGVVFAAYPDLAPRAEPELHLERAVSESSPEPDDEVDVTVTVTNRGDGTLADLRILDGVPPALSVVDALPRRGTALRPGESDSFTYTVRAERGTHGFEPATVVARDVAGAVEVETTVGADDRTELDCTADLSAAPVRPEALQQVGRISADSGGTGTEFYRTREYRPGDSLGRIDWNRYAATGELTTTEYREERATSVLVAVDARRTAYRGPEGETHAVVRCVAGARRLVDVLDGTRNPVGIVGFGRSYCLLEPDTGREHTRRAHRILATHETFDSRRPTDSVDFEAQATQLRSTLNERTQLVLLSPLCDDDIVRFARRLQVAGHGVTVITPDPTDEGSDGRRLARVERRNREMELRDAGVRVVLWSDDQALETALDRAARRWSR
ncbi:DUF58 domain-containing protein [Haloarchaeobius baliensis]|uniref:DUF58 domain-containing protein n=1 Tax=Haloarchaeobius baliensis TaxID=1670458 RepID=UPI003F8849F2